MLYREVLTESARAHLWARQALYGVIGSKLNVN
jgi:hypothetical protein